MAFQHPVARPARRAAAPPLIETSAAAPRRPDPEPVSDSQEWVLFSPEPRRTDAPSASESLLTPRTAAKSRISDFGSLDTGALSERDAQVGDDDDDNEDLDSLDDGLHAFNEPATSSSANAVDPAALDSGADAILPAHDGLGAFPGTSSPVQEQFWRHERNNPRRRRQSLRRPSLQKRVDVLDDHEEHQQTVKDERFQRIEKWRMDQSRAIMEEIERESRRLRRKSRLSTASSTTRSPPAVQDDVEEQEQEQGEEEEEPPADEAVSLHGDVEATAQPASETFWTRLTRHVMHDLMGFDHATLHYIFGENVPTTATLSREAEMAQEAERVASEEEQPAEEAQPWEVRLLARIARELGTFVHQVSEHPGAFGTYLKTRDDVPYAGLPTPPQLLPEGSRRRHGSGARHRRRVSAAKTDPSLFGIEEEAEDNELTPQVSRQQEAYELSLQREREYWERDVDVKMVFGFLRSRLSRSPAPPSPPAGASLVSGAGSPRPPTASSNPSDSLRRAALIRHHHPLVSKTRVASESLPLPLSPILGRRSSSVIEDDAASSCASQSTKKSKTRHSGSISLGSSRNYWDIGGPAWGEV